MLVKIELITILKDQNTTKTYFLCKEPKALLLKTFDVWPDLLLDQAKNVSGVLASLELKPILVELADNETANIATADKNGKFIKVTLSAQTAVLFGQYFQIPVFIDSCVLKREAIFITKKFIEEILLC